MMAALALNRLITQEFNPFVPNAQIDFLQRGKLDSDIFFTTMSRFGKYNEKYRCIADIK